jgi:citrate lyase subunit beta / citryl-CoA lyase
MARFFRSLSMSIHPDHALFAGEKPFPVLPAVEHFAGSEKMILKALSVQASMGPVFDITCDCEDGAPAGAERAHAQMVARLIQSPENRFGRVGVRIHDITHPHWRHDIEILVREAGPLLAYVTFPKVRSVADLDRQLLAFRDAEARFGLEKEIPVHVLIETHGALRDVWKIASLAGIESLDFGIMDFVSAHHGAIPGAMMKSPGQFEHPLIVRAKTEIAAAALAHGLVPSHNVSTELTDTDAIREDAFKARNAFGYLRMWSIHPHQIRPILEAMQPDFSEVHLATAILEKAQAASWGPIRHENTLHDRASFRYYWALLKRAKSTGMALPETALPWFAPVA